MQDAWLRSLIGGQQNLPKPPTAYGELSALTQRPDATLAGVARLIERDVGTATEVLKLVNSSFFGMSSDVDSIERAVALLGLDVIGALVLTGSVFTTSAALPPDLDARALAERGLRTYLDIRSIGRLEGWEPGLVGHVGLAGLLYDVGLLVLAAGSPEGWSAYRSSERTAPERLRQEAAFGCSVGRASAYLLGLWGFHPSLVEILVEQPLDLQDAAGRAASPAALAVAFARLRGDGITLDPAGWPSSHDAAYLTPRRLTAWEACRG